MDLGIQVADLHTRRVLHPDHSAGTATGGGGTCTLQRHRIRRHVVHGAVGNLARARVFRIRFVKRTGFTNQLQARLVEDDAVAGKAVVARSLVNGVVFAGPVDGALDGARAGLGAVAARVIGRGVPFGRHGAATGSH